MKQQVCRFCLSALFYIAVESFIGNFFELPKNELTPPELRQFKERVQPLREELKKRYGEEACAAFKIDMEKNF